MQKRSIEETVDVAVRVFCIDVRKTVGFKFVFGVFVSVQSQQSLLRRKYAAEKQEQKIGYVLADCAHWLLFVSVKIRFLALTDLFVWISISYWMSFLLPE